MAFLSRIAIFMLVIWSAHGTTYFVRFDTGNDANNGTSTATPWKRCPGDLNATSVAAATPLIAGDVIQFHSATYTGTINLNWSGTVGNPIVYDGTTWTGTRCGITTAFAPGTSAFQTSSTRRYLMFTGLDVHQVGGWPYNHAVFSGAANSITPTIAAARYGAGINMLEASAGIIVTNCIFRELGHWTNVVQNASEGTISGVGVYFQRGATNNIVVSNKFSKVSRAIDTRSRFPYRAVGNRYIGNTITNHIRWGITLIATGDDGYFEDNVIQGGIIGDYSEYDQLNWLGGGDSPHTDGLFIGNNYNDNVTWITNGVDGVRFYTDNPGNPANAGGTAAIFISQGPGFFVRNCLFLMVRHPVSLSVAHINYPGAKQLVFIQHNTWIGGGWPIRCATATDPLTRSLYINNNIFIGDDSTVALLIEQNAGFIGSLNGNLYYNTTLASNVWNVGNITGVDNTAKFADLKTAGYEANGLYANPLFMSAVAPWRTADLALQDGSDGINAGLNLTNAIRTDYLGVSRIGKALTMGAHVYVPVTPPPADTNAPTPNPMTLVSAVGTGPNTATVVATTATDDSGGVIVYEFWNQTYGSIVTQTNPVRLSVGLLPATTYTYSVRARDPTGNLTDWSSTLNATTDGPTTLRAVTALTTVVSNLVTK